LLNKIKLDKNEKELRSQKLATDKKQNGSPPISEQKP
jgi:hypothetical protein